MVKKISGNTPARPTGTTKVGGTQKTQSVQGADAVKAKSEIQTTGVKSVGGVQGSSRSTGSQRIRNNTRPLTSAEREFLLELVSEEAEKLFGGGKISPRKRQIIEQSVKISLSAGGADGDEEE